jgi:hypothetical protein
MVGLLRFVLVIVFCLSFGTVLNAQPGSNPGGGGKPGGVPISGIEILLVLGGIAGARKIIAATRRDSK